MYTCASKTKTLRVGEMHAAYKLFTVFKNKSHTIQL